MNHQAKPYSLPDGSAFTEENYWRYIMKDLPRPWENEQRHAVGIQDLGGKDGVKVVYESMPAKHDQKRHSVQASSRDAKARLRHEAQGAEKAKAKRK